MREEHTDKALAILRVWDSQDIRPAAPYLMPFEVANALHRRITQGELSVEAAADLIGSLLSSRLELHQPPNLHRRALELAGQLKQGAVYDAHYLWRWLRVSIASCGPPTRGFTERQAQALKTCAG